MRIISPNFHDYYDTAMGFGTSGVQYIRKKEEEISGQNFWYEGGRWRTNLKYKPTTFKHHGIGFCGKLYRCIEIDGEFIYSIEELDDYILNHYGKKTYDEYLVHHSLIYRKIKYIEISRKAEDRFFNPPTNEWDLHANREMERKKCPVFSISGHTYKNNVVYKIWNDSLRRFHFYKVFDPYTAYQEIEMYLNNIAWPEKPIPKLDDVTMSEIKGFDKYSFRKDKTKK